MPVGLRVGKEGLTGVLSSASAFPCHSCPLTSTPAIGKPWSLVHDIKMFGFIFEMIF
jgi:hypothetical protein